MPRRRGLDRDRVLRTALALVDARGLEALSVRALAAELGVGPMTLYSYFADRDDVLAGLVDLLFAGLPPLPRCGPWRPRLEVACADLHGVLAAHSALLPVVLGRRHRGPAQLRWMEGVLEVLADAGLDAAGQALAFRLLSSYVTGAAVVGHHAPPAAGGGAPVPASVPTDLPLVTAVRQAEAGGCAAGAFEHGLGVVLDGVAAMRAG